VRAALSLLDNTALTLAEVAKQSGFNSIQTLARQVRQATGRTPRALRGG
jgi:AraC-like DNA-binding protein